MSTGLEIPIRPYGLVWSGSVWPGFVGYLRASPLASYCPILTRPVAISVAIIAGGALRLLARFPVACEFLSFSYLRGGHALCDLVASLSPILIALRRNAPPAIIATEIATGRVSIG